MQIAGAGTGYKGLSNGILLQQYNTVFPNSNTLYKSDMLREMYTEAKMGRFACRTNGKAKLTIVGGICYAW